MSSLPEQCVCCFSVQVGKTVIERNSEDFSVISPDPDRFRTMYKKVQDAFDSKTQYYIDRVSIKSVLYSLLTRQLRKLSSPMTLLSKNNGISVFVRS
jgi:hypothetical protein